MAGRMGANVLSMAGFNEEELASHIRSYRQARIEAGHDPRTGVVSLMLHTYLGEDREKTRELVREPIRNYLLKYMEQFRSQMGSALRDPERLADQALEVYCERASLLGTPESCGPVVARLGEMGVKEIACLIDFGLEYDEVLRGLARLKEFVKIYE